jgi:VanZ family protein
LKKIAPLLWTLPFLYMMMIWHMSGRPDNTYVELPDSTADAFIKESLHLVEFAILYLLFVMAAYFNGKLTAALSITFAIIAGLYGILDEIHQSFIPSRSASIIDVIKDITGVAVAYFIIKKKLRL